MKRAWKPRHPPEVMFIGESEHSGDPRRESSLRDPRSESKIPEGNSIPLKVRPKEVEIIRKL